MMRKIFVLSLMMLSLSNCALAMEKPMLIDQIPLDTKTFAPSDGAKVEQFPEQKAVLDKEVQEFLRGKYSIVSQRFVVLNSHGAMIESGITDYVYNHPNGRKVERKTLPSEGSIVVWEVGDDYCALASSSLLPDGNVLYIPIELKKKDK